jgi:alpha-L-fucosidase
MNILRLSHLAAALLIASLSLPCITRITQPSLRAQPAPDTPPDNLRPLAQPDPARDARVAWHKDARFGCFVHWGVYADPAGEWDGRRGGGYSEHIMRQLKIPRQVYLDKIARPFNPAHFDADAWVRLMRDAGMRYLIITGKHHDGFAIYPSKVSDFNITVTQFPKDRDIMSELSAACKKYGLKFGFYYSHAFDWEHPDAPGNDWDYDNPGGGRLLHGRDWWENYPQFLPRAQHYVDTKSIPQIRELVETYHPDILWFDTPGKLPPSENRRILAAVRAMAPDTVVNGRILGDYGDYKNTADRPAYFPATPGHWESIPTTNESYGYHRHDHSHKTPAHFIQLLAMTVGKGGNMLLNIGPRGDGTIDPVDAAILGNIGAWMRVNGESIYGCDRTPLPVQSWGASTRKGNRLYLHVFDWPKNGRLVVSGLRTDASAARLLATTAPVTPRRIAPEDVELTLPATAPDKSDTVIVLDFATAPEGDKAIRIAPEQGVTTTLHVMDGALSGKGISYGDGKRTRDVVDTWNATTGAVTWQVRATAPLRVRVVAAYNTGKKDDGGMLAVAVAGQVRTLVVTPTENATDFRTDVMGIITLQPGEHTITARPQRLTGANLMRLRQLELTVE